MLTTAALAACGPQGGDGLPGPSSADPRATPVQRAVEGYFGAVRAANGQGICAHLAPALRHHVARLQAQPCEEALTAEARRLPESLAGYRVQSIRFEGRMARVILAAGSGFPDELTLEQVDGQWLITSAPGLAA
ncbi:MAG: hypothetical protein ACRDM7_13960 [Thermoleophilaceae bacterium]